MPRILITNDDGISAPGIHALEASLARIGVRKSAASSWPKHI